MPRGEPIDTRRLLLRVYRRLRDRYGHAGWWPGESSFEVCVGAILVQNTAWVNVERTLASLRRRGLLSFEALHRRPPSRLAPLLRSSGTFRVKARRLRAFLDFLGAEYGGQVEGMRAERPEALRRKLLAVPGIGPETADSIALYAAGSPSSSWTPTPGASSRASASFGPERRVELVRLLGPSRRRASWRAADAYDQCSAS